MEKYNSSKELGNKYESEAMKLEAKSLSERTHTYDTSIRSKYELAGKYFFEAGDLARAKKNYQKILHDYSDDERVKKRVNVNVHKIDSLLQNKPKKSLEGRVKDEGKKKKKKFFEPGFWDRVLKPNYPWAILSIASFMFALFFISANLTGYATSVINVNDSKWMGFCFFACGLIFTYVFLNSKKRF